MDSKASATTTTIFDYYSGRLSLRKIKWQWNS